jgi:hypothetical protein
MISRSLPSDRRTPLVYIALGDSTVNGLGTAVDVLTNQVADAVLHQPGWSPSRLARTTCARVVPPDDFARRVEVILERLHRETDAVVLLNALPDLARAPRFREPERSMMAALIRHYNHAIRHVADGFGIDLVDLDIGERPEHEQRSFFSEDGYHPSDAGYAAWAVAMWQAVRRQTPERAQLVARPA